MTFERVIAAPVECVWAVMTDIERYAGRFAKVDAAVLLDDWPFGVASRWRESRIVYGRSATLEICVIECEALLRYLTEAQVGARATTEFVFTPSADGTRTPVQVRFQTRGGGLWYRLAGRLSHQRIRECVIENNSQDLADLAHACET